MVEVRHDGCDSKRRARRALENDEDACDDEKPRHKVTLTRFDGQICSDSGIVGKCDGSNHFFKGVNRPVEKVSWLNVVDFCNKLEE